MLALHRAGHIELPPIRKPMPNPFVDRQKPAPVEVDSTPLVGTLSEIGALEIREVRRKPEERIVNGLIAAHHFLGYTQPVGEQLKYLISTGGRPIACFAWSSAPRHLAPRDRFIGWTPETRRKNLHYVAYNTRFLILPWVRVPHLASHLLGWMAKHLSVDWERMYGHPVYFLETFVDPTRNRGTCYRAANWTFLGKTTGRGNNDRTNKPNRPIKDVLGYPLTKAFRMRLGGS